MLLFAAIFRFDMIWGFFGTIFGILTPVLYGFAFAFILNPVVKRLHKLFMKTVFKKTKKVHRAEKISRAISIVISILLLFVVITVFSLMLFPQLVTNIMGFYNNFESYYNNFMGWLDGILKQDSKSAEFILQALEKSKEMLQSLAGNWHHVYTGVTVINTRSGRILRNVEKTRVHIVPMTEEEIDAYVATGEPLDKAGAYAIQGMGGMFVDRIDGSYSNVVGLPMAMLRTMLVQIGGMSERGVV